MLHNYASQEEECQAFSKCHTRSAHRVLRALLANGGVFIKMGQHMASLIVLPEEWRKTMAVLQDRCEPTNFPDLEDLFLKDMGYPISDIFSEFDPTPIGVASLAQVHIGRYRETGERVAVKDPHPGNLLIRPAPVDSLSPYNFEIVLLDHGLYFDLDPTLRENYGKLWLSLMAPASPTVMRNRRTYAELVGNIGADLYPVFEAAITGRVALEGSWEDGEDSSFQRASSVVDMVPQTDQEKDMIRNAVLQREGVLISVFDVLRRIPRRILMVLKLNDLTRSLDHSLRTTHSNIRVFVVMAKFCTDAVWLADERRYSEDLKQHRPRALSILCRYFATWITYRIRRAGLSLTECMLDLKGFAAKNRAWLRGLWAKGLQGAHNAEYGLDIA
ncbi:hypothetical protein CVT24_009427 [Panaeolus cyanescens]|uniref:ABC1 atypical kinase-like domain-containing protein n=1 Tax=Panaeolus cyanescens TaxID=181874 RepID=A0A409VAS8_9AGAR|nr:hypothetical protein CVT24_009427 [Panaeolus cyanescens]